MYEETIYRIIIVLILVVSVILGILFVNALVAEVERQKKLNGS